jgi:hypothetical protein
MRAAQSVMADLAVSGLTAEQLALVIELSATVAAEARPVEDKSAQRRRAKDRAYQADKRRQNRQISADSDDAVGSNERDILTSREDLPQEPNGSLPQGAKRTKSAVRWSCPLGVQPGHWSDFLANRSRKRCAQTQTAYDAVLADIAKFADDEWPPGRLVEHAAAKGWASINDPRSDYGKRPHSERQSGWETAYHANMGAEGHS